MAKYSITIHKNALRDRDKIEAVPALKKKVSQLIAVLENNPFTPPYEKLSGTLDGIYSRRINKQHRLVYLVDEAIKEIKILRMWTHYE